MNEIIFKNRSLKISEVIVIFEGKKFIFKGKEAKELIKLILNESDINYLLKS